jgi:DNA-binding HxlR family transcriptional regulator
MRTYGQYCPMAMALEVLGERWTLLIVRDLASSSRRFNDLARGLPGISRTLLAQRLRHLERDGVVERHAAGHTVEYGLTAAGQELQPVIDILVAWGARWAFGEPDADHLDPVVLLWWMRDAVRRDCLPPERLVLQFDFSGARTDTLWLRLYPDDVSVCLTAPGGEIDLLVTADLATLYRVWVGRVSLAAARRGGSVRLDGPPSLVRAFPGWWSWPSVPPPATTDAATYPEPAPVQPAG